jgi:hypothetical protein
MSRYSDSSLASGLGRRRVHHRSRRGRGVGSIIGSIADHIFGLGRKRRRTYRRRRHVGLRKRVYNRRRIGGLMGIQMGMRRRIHHRRHYKGRGILDKLKSAGSFALPVVASAILSKAGSSIGSRLFGGRRHIRSHHRRRGRGHILL